MSNDLAPVTVGKPPTTADVGLLTENPAAVLISTTTWSVQGLPSHLFGAHVRRGPDKNAHTSYDCRGRDRRRVRQSACTTRRAGCRLGQLRQPEIQHLD